MSYKFRLPFIGKVKSRVCLTVCLITDNEFSIYLRMVLYNVSIEAYQCWRYLSLSAKTSFISVLFLSTLNYCRNSIFNICILRSVNSGPILRSKKLFFLFSFFFFMSVMVQYRRNDQVNSPHNTIIIIINNNQNNFILVSMYLA